MNPPKMGLLLLIGKKFIFTLAPFGFPEASPWSFFSSSPLPSFPTTDATKECVARQCGSICLFFLNSSGQVKSFHLSSVYLFSSLADLSAKANRPSPPSSSQVYLELDTLATIQCYFLVMRQKMKECCHIMSGRRGFRLTMG